jgi:hypothetical protein
MVTLFTSTRFRLMLLDCVWLSVTLRPPTVSVYVQAGATNALSARGAGVTVVEVEDAIVYVRSPAQLDVIVPLDASGFERLVKNVMFVAKVAGTVPIAGRLTLKSTSSPGFTVRLCDVPATEVVSVPGG